MTRLSLFLFVASLSVLTGCSTVSDLVTTHIPDGRHGRTRIVVDLRKQKALLYKGKAEVAESRISTGREGHNTPTGRFDVIRKDADHRSSIYGDYVNEGGRVVIANVDVRKTARPAHTHFVGASMPYFVEFMPGYGFHAGYLPGYPASHGCVRMPFWKARQFYNAAKLDTPIVIKNG
jgi:lipoprotein-anchoring transpeptidase ErfK/SrfK